MIFVMIKMLSVLEHPMKTPYRENADADGVDGVDAEIGTLLLLRNAQPETI